LKRNDVEEDTDPCELAAHYRLKYGLAENDLTKSLPPPSLQHSQNSINSMQSNLSTSITSTAVPTIQEMDSDSDSDKSSPLNNHKAKPPQFSSSTVEFRKHSPRGAAKFSPKIRHSSYTSTSQSESDFIKEISPQNKFLSNSAGHKTTSSPSLQIPHQYDYVRNSIAVSEGITEVYESSPRLERRSYESLEVPVDAQGTYVSYACV